MESVGERDYDVILLDVNLPDQSGLDALRRLKSKAITASVVMISGQEDVQVVVEAMRLGAIDYLVKPLDGHKVLATVALASRAGRLERENRRLQQELQQRTGRHGQLIGHSPALRRLAGVVSRVAESDATALVEGRPGTGKTLVAHLIHSTGRRSSGPLVTVQAETVSAEQLDDLLAQAHKGVLVVEDIERLAAAAQARLVRYLKEERSRAELERNDTRIVATTSARLPELVAGGRFREDLFYRLNVFPVQVPGLAERRDDIALLATHFLQRACAAHGGKSGGFTASAMILLEAHPWPGNVAQLEHAVYRAQALAGTAPIDRVHLLGPSTGVEIETEDHGLTDRARPRADDEDDDDVREEAILPFETEEKRLLARALRATRGNVRRAAELLKIGRATLYRKIQIYKLRLQ